VTSTPALLEVAGLSIRFGGLAALSDVDLTVAAGEIFAMIGPNGAGKTTVFNVVTGLYRPLAGRVRFDGHDLLARAPHAVARLGVARTFQNTEVFRGLSALDNVLIGAHSRLRGNVMAAALGLPGVRREESRVRARAHALLARVGLGDAAGRDAAGLPLGLQKRLELARALALQPRLLLLDEPAGGLNPTETQELMQLIRSLRDDDRLTILLVEHNMELVMGVSDRVAVLQHGRKLAEGTPVEVSHDPAVVEAYLGGDD
jgi:branched-chain amino acid transport system ATP-binding protein